MTDFGNAPPPQFDDGGGGYGSDGDDGTHLFGDSLDEHTGPPQQQRHQPQPPQRGDGKRSRLQAPVAVAAPTAPCSSGGNTASFDWQGFDQVSSLQQTHEALLTKVDAQAAEIARLKRVVSTTAAATNASSRRGARGGGGGGTGEGGPGGAAAARVQELSKRNRELNARVTSEQARCRTLKDEASQLQATVASLQGQLARAKRQLTKQQHNGSPPGTDTAQQLQHQERQIPESQKLVECRSEIQQLKQELKVVKRALVQEVGNEALVAKALTGDGGWKGRSEQISRLKAKVAELQQTQGHSARSSRSASRSGGVDTHIDPRHKSALNHLQSKKRKDLVETQARLEQLESDHAALKEVCAALKARNKVLGRDLKAAKAAAAAAREEQRSLEQQQESNPDGLHNAEAMEALASLTNVCRKQKATIARLESEARQRQSRPSSLTSPRERPPRHLRPLSSMSSKSDESSVSSSFRGPPRGRPLSATEGAELKVLQVEKARLTELIALLKQQVEQATAKCADAEAQLCTERRRAALSNRTSSSDVGRTKPSLDQLEEKLALQLDENEALKETLRTTLEAKEQEIALLHQMMRDTRRVFSEAMQKAKKK
eukprot:m.222939 g.222939  ORF g.222939 m.222939 type:complete len:603 (-) comp18741_c0_seq2:175-1983(-)